MILHEGVPDLALTWDLAEGAADLALEADDLATDDGLRTAVLLSLFVDRRALDSDVLPGGDQDDDRRGWWGDEFAEAEGDLVGSRLWLLARAKSLPGIEGRVEDYVREALAWMLEDRVARQIDVAVTLSGHVISLVITVHRPVGDAVAFRFAHTWEAEAARAV